MGIELFSYSMARKHHPALEHQPHALLLLIRNAKDHHEPTAIINPLIRIHYTDRPVPAKKLTDERIRSIGNRQYPFLLLIPLNTDRFESEPRASHVQGLGQEVHVSIRYHLAASASASRPADGQIRVNYTEIPMPTLFMCVGKPTWNFVFIGFCYDEWEINEISVQILCNSDGDRIDI